MAKKASKARKSTSSSASASNPTTTADGKTVLKIKSTKKVGKAATKQSRPKSAKKKAVKIDADKPKKPPTAFFYFLEDFRKAFQEQNPGVKSMRDIGKACGEKWKTMTYEEKVQYYDIATQKRAEFDRAMADYVKRKESGEDKEVEDSDSDY